MPMVPHIRIHVVRLKNIKNITFLFPFAKLSKSAIHIENERVTEIQSQKISI